MMFLETSQVTFSYSRKMNPAVTGINLELGKNNITAIVGPNGSGKTTVTKLLIGVLQPTVGKINLEGQALAGFSLAAIGRRIGYVFQNPNLQLFCRTVAEEIGFGLINQGCNPVTAKEKVNFYLDYFELAAYRDAFPMYLSQGEKQRVAIAAVLASEPEYLILDEPTVSLDASRKRLLGDYLQKIASRGRGMLLISHDMSFVNRMAERVIIMENGRIQADSWREGNDFL